MELLYADDLVIMADSNSTEMLIEKVKTWRAERERT